ncbi:MAG: SusF/SusE family outer membrane protein [Bacteroidetes bacterium]|nr:SusF/SusE family outer membrane protein [Bacteroidota bacterium]
MKKIKYLLIVLLAVFIFSCEEEFMTPLVTLPVEGTAPVWVNEPPSDIDTILFKKDENNTIVPLSWTAPVYADNIGVRYYLQIDSKGNNFQNPIGFDRISETEMVLTVGALNSALTQRYMPAVEIEIELRIRAASNEDLADLYTTPFSMKVTPYLDVPVPSNLFMLGTATSVGFDNTASLVALKDGDVFYKYLKLTNDGLFRFADAQNDGAFKYNFGKFATVSSNIEAAGDDDANYKFTGETGWYEVKADFTNSELTIAPFIVDATTYTSNPSEVYLVGDYSASVPAWSPGESPSLTEKSDGIYTIETEIKDGAMLKFVGQPSWGNLDWGNLGSDGVDGNIGPKGKNGNITFDGGDKAYIVTLNLNDGTYTIVEAKSNLFIVGEATTAGWDINNALEMNIIAPGIWAGTFELKAGKDFKFFPEIGSWDNGIGADQFDNFVGCTNPGNGNITNAGAVDGNYLVVVDLNSKTLTVSDSPKILGGSVIADWNPGNAVSMQMVENGVYETYQYITADGGGFKFVPTNAGWDGDWGASKTETGFLAQNDEDNLTVDADGFYRVRVNMNDMSYTVVETSWGIIGSASPGGWDNDTDMTFTAAKGEYVWSADITLTDGDIKFRANDGWDINLGDTGVDGSLEYGGDNIVVTAGNYHIELILNSAIGFTYTITAN